MHFNLEEVTLDSNKKSPRSSENSDQLPPQSEFFHNSGRYIDHFFEKLKYGYQCIQAKEAQGPKFPVNAFCYEEKIEKNLICETGKNSEQVLEALANIVDGSIRPQSPHAVFNMVPNPMLDTIVAASLMQLYNVNAIMDTYGGKALLFEQQVARSIGKLIGWDQATGIACNGGKITLFYAIKSAITRIASDADQKGIPNDLVILTADGAHYSLEHTCSLLGLGTQQCIRVPIHSSNGMQANELKAAFESQIAKGKRVAAIIACGGTTLDFLCDNTQVIHNTVTEVVDSHQLDYFPYLHLDSVIGWLWFSFLQAPTSIYQKMNIHPDIQLKIQSVLDKLQGMHRFDSFGVDFHKNALCPYASSFFISKALAITTRTENDGSVKERQYGELRAFDHTLENSRPASGIASAWTALQRLGKQGLRAYLAQLLASAEQIKASIRRYQHAAVLNDSSLGWEVIFTLNPSTTLAQQYEPHQLHEDFYRYITERTNMGDDVPSISIIKDFRKSYGENVGHGFICYNMTPGLTTLQAEKLTGKIMTVFAQYEQAIETGVRCITDQELIAPIR
ncbi:glutamate decarboxylase [Endozoicomonas sp. SM1973]|uniref:Glutamate decarboxylase n=1 Tax=Spartinivicinus marinus TaxID=2994442 RepID=A0A853IBN1_9GAMM|nr:pyridoxal-dependent decarboxylase [Spartinivicinus marinus]MCX4029682.1 pyridoxal-dependent decarboxylase [Spartinivicinus marinus]NYZ66937.1 glutamate decarboxylase [Spartinivicinus marinus]